MCKIDFRDARTLGSTDLSNLDQMFLDAIQAKIQNTFDTSLGPIQTRFRTIFLDNEAKIYIRNSGMGDYKLSAHTDDAILWHKDFLSTRDAADAQVDVRNLINAIHAENLPHDIAQAATRETIRLAKAFAKQAVAQIPQSPAAISQRKALDNLLTPQKA